MSVGILAISLSIDEGGTPHGELADGWCSLLADRARSSLWGIAMLGRNRSDKTAGSSNAEPPQSIFGRVEY
jgi:hypothetical protein